MTLPYPLIPRTPGVGQPRGTLVSVQIKWRRRSGSCLGRVLLGHKCNDFQTGPPTGRTVLVSITHKQENLRTNKREETTKINFLFNPVPLKRSRSDDTSGRDLSMHETHFEVTGWVGIWDGWAHFQPGLLTPRVDPTSRLNGRSRILMSTDAGWTLVDLVLDVLTLSPYTPKL